ncbi:rhodanese-like domain-containing protein [uncultured Aquimarina sp.]|uniref:rhodanese-like domain-containing protein n=1 Tax=uncultured Aquimarina sp. TaxID=575652 RepID=UPI00260615EE|nr:rhodanese-like domain-containing protein [uncultured Aquimarina sp.]
MAEDITQNQWEDLIANDTNAIILDVRSEEEVEDGFIPNMLNLDIRQGQGFLDEVEKLDKSKNYYVYCRSGARSAQACALMNQMGFETTYNLIGGFMNWDGEVAE